MKITTYDRFIPSKQDSISNDKLYKIWTVKETLSINISERLHSSSKIARSLLITWSKSLWVMSIIRRSKNYSENAMICRHSVSHDFLCLIGVTTVTLIPEISAFNVGLHVCFAHVFTLYCDVCACHALNIGNLLTFLNWVDD